MRPNSRAHRGRDRAAPLPIAASLMLALPACTAVLDVDEYVFVADAAPQQIPEPLGPDMGASLPPLPLPTREPRPEQTPESLPIVDPVPPPAMDAGGSVPDAAPPVVVEPPPMDPPPMDPLPRPVVVAEADSLLQLNGSPTGGQPRLASCPGGVVYGVYYRYYASLALEPDRLTYVWPMCNLLEPGTPNLGDGMAYDANWPVSTAGDPAFADLRENEFIDWLGCPVEQNVVGIEGTYDEPVGPSVALRSLAIRCATLNTDVESSTVVQGPFGTFAASGISPVFGALSFARQCPEGQAATVVDLRFGNWLDAVGLRCSVVRWPFTAGHACATGPECQSGYCGTDGRCAP